MEWLVAHQITVIGIIWMVVLGTAVGNYACSVVYRLPLGKTPFERHPYCGSCNADLKPVDLFPILSWLSTRGKCRYCAAKVPAIYTVIELVCGALFVANFLQFGISESFLLLTSYGVFVVILAAIHWQHGWISQSIFTYAMLCIALTRTLHEGTIYGWVHGGFLMLMLAIALMRLAGNKTSPFEKSWVWWFVLMGTLVPMTQWLLVTPIFVIKLLIPKSSRVIVYAAGALALPYFVF